MPASSSDDSNEPGNSSTNDSNEPGNSSTNDSNEPGNSSTADSNEPGNSSTADSNEPGDSSTADSNEPGDSSETGEPTSHRDGFDELGNAQLLVVCGIGLTAIGSVLPWFAGSDQIVLGIEDGGLLTLPLVSVLVTLLLFYGWRKNTGLLCLVVGTLVSFVTFFSLTAGSAFGVYLALLGGLSIAVGGLLLPELASSK